MMRCFTWSLVIACWSGLSYGQIPLAEPSEAPVIQPRVAPPAPEAPADLPADPVPMAVSQPDAPVPMADDAPMPTFEAPGPDEPADEDWTIEIVPGAGCAGPNCSRLAYEQAYDSIPFRRSEWLANASYRHDSAMALMTGQPINGRTLPNRQLEIYQDPRPYRRTFFPRLAPADLHYNYAYGRYQYRPWGWWGWYGNP